MDHGTDDQSWLPQASLDVQRLRARVYQNIREFFKQRNILEVDTPCLASATSTDVHINSFTTHFDGSSSDGLQQQYYLSTSPEFFMKRLLAAGSGSIYQLCHVFRQSEFGAQHNPEFTMLEWYRVGMQYHDLMEEVATLVQLLLKQDLKTTEYLTYQQAFVRYIEIDPLSASTSELQQCAEKFGFCTSAAGTADKDLYLDFLMSHQVQPRLGNARLTFVYEYPASQCALAQLSPGNDQVAERFELFVQGVELANGFQELTDAQEQLARFESDLKVRAQQGADVVQYDSHLIDALNAGLPDCSGVAVGIDRLIQLMLDQKKLGDVLAFPFNRA